MPWRATVPALRELQRRVADVLCGQAAPDTLAECIASGRVPLATRIGVHRNTVRGGLCHALRLRHPTVASLLGEQLFDQTALAYAAVDWPREPQLDAWGAGFAEFLQTRAPVAAMSWLHEVARFDALLDALGAGCDDGPRESWSWQPLADGAELALAPSLRLLAVTHPVDEIRTAVAAGGPEALARIQPSAGPLRLAAWRCGTALKTRRIGARSAEFLDRLLAGRSPVAALGAALVDGERTAAGIVEAIEQEVLAAPFAALRAAARAPL
jgi:hypothetical protein